MDRKMVNFIKEQYPPGTRIRLNSMGDPYAPILPGTDGEVDFVDDAGSLHMKWDNGRSLALIPGEDSFTVLPPKLTTLKLYRVVFAFNTLIRLFNSQENIVFIEREIRAAWAKMKGQPVDIIFQFVATFYNVIPDEALSYLKTRIDTLPEAHLDIQKYDFAKNSNYHTIRSKIIDILIGFKYTDHFIDAIQLALYYFEKIIANQWIFTFCLEKGGESVTIPISTIMLRSVFCLSNYRSITIKITLFYRLTA